METKVCKECGRELPIEQFSKVRNGIRISTCKECVTAIRKENKQKKLEAIEQQRKAYYAEFDGKEPVEVLKLMGRAKNWLEAKGYEVTLRATYTIKKEIKFNEL